MTLWRWLADNKLNFPRPALRVRDRRFWSEADLIAWEKSFVPRGNATPDKRSKRRRAAGTA
jgi:hypothetical protein